MAQDINSRSGVQTALLLGAGYTARALATNLQEDGYRVYGTCRNIQQANKLAQFSIHPIVAPSINNPEIKRLFNEADIIISSIPPHKKKGMSGFYDPVISAFSYMSPRAKWIGYLSATSVYGDREGQWAFEGEPASPQLKRGIARAEAELNWLETGWPVHIFRLAGIYGPDRYGPSRHPFAKLKNGTARAIIKAGHVVNRIHVEDIATAIMASIDRPNPLAIYNIADGHPAAPQDVLDYAAQLMGVSAPPRVTLNDPSVSEMARSFYSETKRVDITRARQDLKWAPSYPDYKVGLQAVWNSLKDANKETE